MMSTFTRQLHGAGPTGGEDAHACFARCSSRCADDCDRRRGTERGATVEESAE